jgi:fructosamine-3-kinase
VTVFVKTRAGAPADFFVVEAAGLDVIRVPGGPPVPSVHAVDVGELVLDWIEAGRPSQAAAREFGRRLAVLHNAGSDTFGAAHPGYIGPLPLDNTPADDWPTFYAERRLLPFLPGLDREIQAAVARVIDHLSDLAGPAQSPARIHGDLWSGNLIWGADGQVWLIDAAAAHGGHRETDLAMLALFGSPYLDDIIGAYQDVVPLAAGWRDRVPLHQLHPLLVHAQLFGGSYTAQALGTARTVCP